MSEYFNLNDDLQRAKKAQKKYFPQLSKRLIIPAIVTLSIPLTVVLALTQTNILKFAGGGPEIAEVRVNPGSINSAVNGPESHLSALAVDSNGIPVEYPVTYEWSMSSTNTVGTLSRTETNLTDFKPLSVGCGQLTVTARNGDNVVTKSVSVVVSDIFNTPNCGPSPTPQPVNRAFVTSTNHDGNLGGLSGADTVCQTRADAANLGGQWKAWISDGTTSAGSRLLHSNNPYKQLNGLTVANDWSDLTDGAISKIYITELNTSLSSQTVYVWTNTKSDGSIKYTEPSKTCNNWTSGSFSIDGGMGSANHPISWTDYSTNYCGAKYRLYCIEQKEDIVSTPTPTAPPPTFTPVPTTAPVCSPSTIPPQSGTAPLTVTLHGGGTAGGDDSLITGYSWDFDNDGVFDSEVSLDPVSHTYQTPGQYTPKYKVHGTNGTTSVVCDYNYVINVSMPTPTFTPVPSPHNKVIILYPTADAFVRATSPNTNFGKVASLETDIDPNEITYLNFNLSQLAGKTIVKASLKLKISDPTPVAQTLRRASTVGWSETGITYNRRPVFEGIITNFNGRPANSVTDLNVRNVVNLRKGGNLTVGITSAGSDSAAYYSRESAAANRPQLIIEYK
jgi:PKD repeat protein